MGKDGLGRMIDLLHAVTSSIANPGGSIPFLRKTASLRPAQKKTPKSDPPFLSIFIVSVSNHLTCLVKKKYISLFVYVSFSVSKSSFFLSTHPRALVFGKHGVSFFPFLLTRFRDPPFRSVSFLPDCVTRDGVSLLGRIRIFLDICSGLRRVFFVDLLCVSRVGYKNVFWVFYWLAILISWRNHLRDAANPIFFSAELNMQLNFPPLQKALMEFYSAAGPAYLYV